MMASGSSLGKPTRAGRHEKAKQDYLAGRSRGPYTLHEDYEQGFVTIHGQ